MSMALPEATDHRNAPRNSPTFSWFSDPRTDELKYARLALKAAEDIVVAGAKILGTLATNIN
jgi:hypothetical protein